jgi:hypothetical protein
VTAEVLETSSRVDEQDASPQTLGRGEWVLPEVEPDQWAMGETTSGKLDGRTNGSPTTAPSDYRRVSAPIRKDSFVPRFPRDRIKLLQQWECVVSQVHDDCVECEMHDLTDESKPVECAEIYLDEFNEFDRALLCEGTVFYWSIGHETKRTGQVRRYSELRVRRMPPLTNLKKREIGERAKQLSELLDAKS